MNIWEVTVFETVERKIVVNAVTSEDAADIALALYDTHPERFEAGNSTVHDFAPYVKASQ